MVSSGRGGKVPVRAGSCTPGVPLLVEATGAAQG
jgi:hypothetical protein